MKRVVTAIVILAAVLILGCAQQTPTEEKR